MNAYTQPNELEYKNYPKEAYDLTLAKHFVSSIEILINAPFIYYINNKSRGIKWKDFFENGQYCHYSHGDECQWVCMHSIVH